MRIFNCLACHLLAILICATPLQAATPKDQTCKLLKSLLDKGATGANSQIGKMADWMQEPTKSQMSHAFSAVQHFKFVSGKIFLIGKLDSFFEEHLLALEIKDNISGYVRITYEVLNGEFKLAQFHFDLPFSKSRDRGAFMQKPEILGCR